MRSEKGVTLRVEFSVFWLLAAIARVMPGLPRRLGFASIGTGRIHRQVVHTQRHASAETKRVGAHDRGEASS